MLKGIAAAASAMVPHLKRQEVIANNLANAGTAGYKRDRVFVQELARARTGSANTAPDWMLPQVTGLAVDFTPGSLKQTGSPYDLAITGDGFFVVSTPNGERYTRNGNFKVDLDGRLTTTDGNPILGRQGEIRLPAGDPHITTDGSVSVDGKIIDQLRLARFTDPSVLTRSASSLFAVSTPGVLPQDDTASVVHQGFLEQSNVNTIEEMVDMITTFRSFESDQRAIRAQDEVLGRVVNELGRVQ